MRTGMEPSDGTRSDRAGLLLTDTCVSPLLENLGEVRSLVEDLATAAHLDEEQTYDLKVAVSEACANAMEHPDKKDKVRVAAWLKPDRLVVEVKAPGEFRVKQSNGNRHRGLGLPLMVALVDEVLFARPRGNGTNVRLSVFLP
jgi:anti-sigma regulatory factor (Ser/Thr protein kinase)